MDDVPKTERALVAFGPGGTAVVIWAQGITVETDVENVSDDADAIGLIDGDAPESGIWVWEGVPNWEDGDDGGDPDYSAGEWRKPTEDEWQALHDDLAFWPTAIGDSSDEPNDA